MTVVTKAYLAYARLLMSRLGDIDPKASRYVFLVDPIDGCFDPARERFTVVTPDEYMDRAELRMLAFQYTAFELCNALRAFAHQYLSRTTTHESWMYFDSDIYPIAAANPMLEERPDASVYITPHILEPCPRHLIFPLETNLLRYGIYNSGWLGIRRSPDAEKFIEWFLLRLRSYCFNFHRDTYVDQLWLNLAPLFLQGVHIVRHAGANIGYWNLHERPLTESAEGDIKAAGQNALFTHFSGWDPDEPNRVSRNYKFPGEPSPVWRRIAVLYRERLLSAGLDECRSWPYGWQRYTDGRVIGLAERRKYADACRKGEWPKDADPFECFAALMDHQPARANGSRRLLTYFARFANAGFRMFRGSRPEANAAKH